MRGDGIHAPWLAHALCVVVGGSESNIEFAGAGGAGVCGAAERHAVLALAGLAVCAAVPSRAHCAVSLQAGGGGGAQAGGGCWAPG